MAVKKKTADKKVKSKRLVLEDYERLLGMAQTANDAELISKLEHKIEQLENPPVRTPREKQGFECVKCKHKFKQVLNHCTTCDSTKIRKISLDEFL